MNQTPIPISATLTPMERELIGYVEQLVSILIQSGSTLTALEARSTSLHATQFTCLSDCVGMLLEQQTALASCLHDLVSGSSTLATLTARTDASLKQLKAVEQRLNSANAQ